MKFLLWMWLWLGTFGYAAGRRADGYVTGVVSRIVDGDTFWITALDGGETLRVRLQGIDAPETHVPTTAGSVGQGAWGHKASHFLSRLLPLNAEVWVRNWGRDRFGRILGRVIYGDHNINRRMVESGWAIPYFICSGRHCNSATLEESDVGGLARACEKARVGGQGIFDRAEPLREMPFEFRLRVLKKRPARYVGDLDAHKYVGPDECATIDVCHRIFFDRKADAARLGFVRAD